MDKNCYVEPIYRNTPSEEELQNAEQVTLAVSGMGCQNCVTRVRNRLLSLEGVYGADVYLHMPLAIVIFNGKKLSPADLIEAVAHTTDDGSHEYRAMLLSADETSLIA